MSLTPRQQDFYDLLCAFATQHSYTPTTNEMIAWLERHGWAEIKSPNTIAQYLGALEDAGLIHREKRKRGVTILAHAKEPAKLQPASGVLDLLKIPLLPNPVACGTPTNMLEDETSEHVQVSPRLVHQPARTYALRCSGDSMDRAGIADGDIVLVESTPEVHDGDIVLANIEGHGTVKRFRKGLSSISLLPESSNPDHQPIYLHAGDDALIAGRVVEVLKQ